MKRDRLGRWEPRWSSRVLARPCEARCLRCMMTEHKARRSRRASPFCKPHVGIGPYETRHSPGLSLHQRDADRWVLVPHALHLRQGGCKLGARHRSAYSSGMDGRIADPARSRRPRLAFLRQVRRFSQEIGLHRPGSENPRRRISFGVGGRSRYSPSGRLWSLGRRRLEPA